MTSDRDNFELADINWSQRERMRVPCFATWSSARASTSSLHARSWNRITFDHQLFEHAAFWIPDMVAANSFVIKKVPTADNISDILTEAIDRKTLDKHLKSMGIVEVRASKSHKQT